MLSIYDKKSSMELPDGSVWSFEDFKNSKFYRPLASVDCVIETDNGILKSFVPLSSFKSMFGVTTEDPEQALAECLEKQKEQEEAAKQESSTISDLQAQMDAICGIES